MEPGKLNRLLWMAGRMHWRRSFAEFAKFSITRGEPHILHYLSAHEGCIQKELCESCHLEPATVTNILARMERESLILRQNAPGNRRNLQVFLTEAGRQRLQTVETVHLQMEKECFADFSEEEKEKAAEILLHICNNMMKAEEQNK